MEEDAVTEITPQLKRIIAAFYDARDRHENSQDEWKTLADRHRRPDLQLNSGDRVWVKTHALSSSAKGYTAKFAPKRDGPYIILRKKGVASYEIAAPDCPEEPLGIHHISALTPVREGDNMDIPVHPIKKRGRPRKIPIAPTDADDLRPKSPTTVRPPPQPANPEEVPRRRRGRPRKVQNHIRAENCGPEGEYVEIVPERSAERS